MTTPGRQPGKRRPSGNRLVAFILTPPVELAILRFLHEVELERGRRVTWDEAFRRLLADAGRPVEVDTNAG